MPRTQKETAFFADSITIFSDKNWLQLQNNYNSQNKGFLPNLRQDKDRKVQDSASKTCDICQTRLQANRYR